MSASANGLGKRKRPTEVRQGLPTASKACEECCRRKSKCDLCQPVCSRCAARNLACVYLERKKPGPPKGCVVRSNKDWRQENSNNQSLFPYVQVKGSKSKGNTTANLPDSPLLYDDTEPVHSFPGASEAPVQPLLDDNLDWEQILGPGLSGGSSQIATIHSMSTQQQPTESPRSQSNRVSNAHSSMSFAFPGSQLRENLIKLYLSRVHQYFPVFPAFRSEKLFASLGHDDERSILLDAICAISARYFEDPSLLGADSQSHAGDVFANRAKAMHVSRISASNLSSVDLDTVKTSLLLAIYDHTRYPGLKSSTSISETVRLAYQFGLDKLDSGSASIDVNMTLEDREDRRYVWWAIWKLDAFHGCMSSLPFAIESPDIQTHLPSGSLEEFVTNGIIAARSHRPLPSDLSRAWKHALEAEIADCQELYLISNSFIRELATLRRLQLSYHDVNQRLYLLENALSSFRIALPEVLQGESMTQPRQNESLTSQRIKAETLLLYHHTCILLYMPNRNDFNHHPSPNYPSGAGMSATSPPDKISRPFRGQWPKCLRSACAIRDVLRELPPALISSLSPTASSGLWYAGLILTLQVMTTEEGDERRQMCSEIDIVLAVLGRMAKYWDIAGAFYKALETLISSSTHVRTSTDIRHLLKEWNGPYLGNQAAPADESLTIIVSPESSHFTGEEERRSAHGGRSVRGSRRRSSTDGNGQVLGQIQTSLDQYLPATTTTTTAGVTVPFINNLNGQHECDQEQEQEQEHEHDQSNGNGIPSSIDIDIGLNTSTRAGYWGEQFLGLELDWLQDDVVMCLDAFANSHSNAHSHSLQSLQAV